MLNIDTLPGKDDYISVSVIGTGMNTAAAIVRINCREGDSRIKFPMLDNDDNHTSTKISTDVIFIVTDLSDNAERKNAYAVVKGANAYISVVLAICPLYPEERYDSALATLEKSTDSVVVISPDKIDNGLAVNEFIAQIFHGIYSLFGCPGLIGLDIADIKAVLVDGGEAFAGIGEARIEECDENGNNAFEQAAKSAMSSPMVAEYISSARKILMNISGSSKNLSLAGVNSAVELICGSVAPSSEVVFGAALDEKIEDKIVVTIIAGR